MALLIAFLFDFLGYCISNSLLSIKFNMFLVIHLQFKIQRLN
jgi:hypothetical protein